MRGLPINIAPQIIGNYPTIVMALMFRKNYTWFSFFLLPLVLGCKKESSETTYHFLNNSDTTTRIDFYGSEVDYAANKNVLFSYTIPFQYTISQGSSIPIPYEIQLTNGKEYWFDWYTANYCANNWLYGNNHLIAGQGADNNVLYRLHDTSRSVLLNSNGLSSTWRGVAIKMDSAYAGFDSLNGTHEFTFYKNRSCAHTIQNKYGTYTSTDSIFNNNLAPSLAGVPRFKISIGSEDMGYQIIGAYDDYFSNEVPTVKTRDTLIVFAFNRFERTPAFKIWRQ